MFEVVEHGEVLQFTMGRKALGRPWLVFNSYLVDGLLVNTGPARFGRRLADACRDRRIEQIVNTSGAPACIGSNARLQREFSLPIRAHRQALPAIRQPQANLSMSFWERLWWGRPDPAKGRRVNSWINTPRFRFRVIPVPEGEQGQICLYEEERGWLFAGNLLAGRLQQAGSLLERLWINQVFSSHLGVVANLDALTDKSRSPASGMGDKIIQQTQNRSQAG